jgi:hypothetical protein
MLLLAYPTAVVTVVATRISAAEERSTHQMVWEGTMTTKVNPALCITWGDVFQG